MKGWHERPGVAHKNQETPKLRHTPSLSIIVVHRNHHHRRRRRSKQAKRDGCDVEQNKQKREHDIFSRTKVSWCTKWHSVESRVGSTKMFDCFFFNHHGDDDDDDGMTRSG